MYKYRVEVYDEDKEFPFNLMMYETITADGYCAELEARKAHPNCKIGQVTRMSDYIESYPNAQTKCVEINKKLGGTKLIKLRIGKEEIVYSDDDLSVMTRGQLKQLKQDLQCNMEEVSAKRARYQAENNEKYNSKEYFTQIAKYKTVMANLKRAIAKVNTYEIDVKENELKDREHWLWSFYVNVKHNIDKNEFEKFVKMTDEDVKYHIKIGE